LVLSSDDIDTIIKQRLLKKNQQGIEKLKEAFNQNSGKIVDVTSLRSNRTTKTDTQDKFITYYPFHHYQFNLLHGFIQAVYSKTKVTERGLIITIFAVLKSLNESKLFNFATAYNLVDGAKQNIDSDLAKKFSNAEKVLKENNRHHVNGSHLMKVIHFINESSQIEANTDNITKLYLNKFDGYYELKPQIEEAINDLCDANLLINKNNIYSITSELEKDKIEEMRNIDVPLYNKKREFIEYLKKQEFINKDLSRIYFENKNYSFSILTRQGDELFKHSKNDELKIQIENIYSVEEEKIDNQINKLKFEMQNIKDTAVLIPSMNKFKKIDRKIIEIYRYKIMEDRYQNDNDTNLRAIIRDLSQNKEKSIRELDILINEAYKEGIIVYDFSEKYLNKDEFEHTFKQIQERMICNTFTERLSVQLSEDLALKVLKADNPKSTLLSLTDNPEVRFFDSSGNFIGEGLRIIENLNSELSESYISGIDLEGKFGKMPYGYDYATIVVSLASLIRAGRLAVKYNGRNIYDYRDSDLYTLFNKSTEFKKGSFKAISATITATQKRDLVEKLKELEAEKYLSTYFDYNTNDLQLVNMVTELSEYFINQVSTYKKQYDDFNDLFPGIENDLTVLREYTQTVTGDNFKETIEKFLNNYSQYQISLNHIQKTISFCEKDLNTARKYKSFVNQVKQELEKIGGTYQNSNIFQAAKEFNERYHGFLCDNFSELQGKYQKVRDEYYRLMKEEHQKMNSLYQKLKQNAQDQQVKVVAISEELNQEILIKINQIISFAEKHCCNHLKISFSEKCENCHYSLNEILYANQTIGIKVQELDQTKTQLQYPDKKNEPKKISIKVLKGKFPVSQYKGILQEKMKEVDSLNDDDIVIIE